MSRCCPASARSVSGPALPVGDDGRPPTSSGRSSAAPRSGCSPAALGGLLPASWRASRRAPDGRRGPAARRAAARPTGGRAAAAVLAAARWTRRGWRATAAGSTASASACSSALGVRHHRDQRDRLRHRAAAAPWSGSTSGSGWCSGARSGWPGALPVARAARVHDRADLHRVFLRLERWAPPADRLARAALDGGRRGRWSPRPNGTDGADMRSSRYGLSATAPARLGHRGSTAARRTEPGEVTHPVLHACTRPLPAERGDFGGGVVERARQRGRVRRPARVRRRGRRPRAVRAAGHARPCAPRSSAPDRLPRVVARTSARRSTSSPTAAGPSACSSVLGSHARRMALVPRAAQVVAGAADHRPGHERTRGSDAVTRSTRSRRPTGAGVAPRRARGPRAWAGSAGAGSWCGRRSSGRRSRSTRRGYVLKPRRGLLDGLRPADTPPAGYTVFCCT